MDPNAAYANLIQALRDCDYDNAQDALDALRGWEEGGGFRPTIPNAPALLAENERLRDLLSAALDMDEQGGIGPKLRDEIAAALAGGRGEK